MLWFVLAVLIGSFAALHATRHRGRDVVFVSPSDPISVVYLRFASRTAQTRAALQAASRLLW